jgi:hypothetical protein
VKQEIQIVLIAVTVSENLCGRVHLEDVGIDEIILMWIWRGCSLTVLARSRWLGEGPVAIPYYEGSELSGYMKGADVMVGRKGGEVEVRRTK